MLTLHPLILVFRVLRKEDISVLSISTSTDGTWTALIGGTTPSNVPPGTKYVVV